MDTISCRVCGKHYPRSHFSVNVTSPALVGDSYYIAKRGKNKGKLVKYSRADWPKRIVDETRPCRACRARAASKASYAKKKAEREALLAETRAYYDKEQIPMPADLIPRKPRLLKGPDPVLEQVGVLLSNTRTTLRHWKEGVHLPDRVTRGNTEFHDALFYLLRARIAVLKMVRHLRNQDLSNPQISNDALRMHWRAYIDREIRNDMDDLAYRVNRLAPPGRGRPWKGLPDLGIPRGNKAAPGDVPRKEFVCAQAWQLLIENIRLTIKASRSALRARHSRVSHRRVLIFGGSFTIEDFHLRRIECAQAAEQTIRRAIEDYVHPAGWVSPWDEGATESRQEGVRSWRALVPPLARNEIETMWHALPDPVRKRLLPFPRLRGKDQRNGFQKMNNLDENNVPLPSMPPAFAQPDSIEMEAELIEVKKKKRSSLPVFVK